MVGLFSLALALPGGAVSGVLGGVVCSIIGVFSTRNPFLKEGLDGLFLSLFVLLFMVVFYGLIFAVGGAICGGGGGIVGYVVGQMTRQDVAARVSGAAGGVVLAIFIGLILSAAEIPGGTALSILFLACGGGVGGFMWNSEDRHPAVQGEAESTAQSAVFSLSAFELPHADRIGRTFQRPPDPLLVDSSAVGEVLGYRGSTWYEQLLGRSSVAVGSKALALMTPGAPMLAVEELAKPDSLYLRAKEWLESVLCDLSAPKPLSDTAKTDLLKLILPRLDSESILPTNFVIPFTNEVLGVEWAGGEKPDARQVETRRIRACEAGLVSPAHLLHAIIHQFGLHHPNNWNEIRDYSKRYTENEFSTYIERLRNHSEATDSSAATALPPHLSTGQQIRWFYARDGKTAGPVPLEEIRTLVASGELRATDFLLREGTQTWVPVGSVPALNSTE